MKVNEDLKNLAEVVKEHNNLSHERFKEPLLTQSQIYSELRIAKKQFANDFKFGVN